MSKPSLPQGTRDFGPDVVRKRNHILNTIRNVFELYGFQPLETPAMENLDTLMGKYGEEGDKLIYRILNSGNPFTQKFISAFLELLLELQPDKSQFSILFSNPVLLETFAAGVLKNESLQKRYQNKLKNEITGKALKYDLTIPFARYVAMNHNQLTFPFKRYQIQPVWRADRPQKGRYREFFQCDADVVGSNSLLNEVELANIYATVFEKLGIDAEIKINNRKILKGIMEVADIQEKEKQILITIDKLDKIGIEGVRNELDDLNIPIENLNKLLYIYAPVTKNEETIIFLKNILSSSRIGMEGVKELEYIVSTISNSQCRVQIDLTLARGLDYYTGIIFEAKAPAEVKMGSIGGGGRYDDLTGLFGVPDIPGVGISFGVDRIYDVMEELNLFPADVHVGTQVLFFNLGEAESKTAFSLMQQLRQKGIRSELYHELSKFDKQFKYAEKKNIPYVIIIGEKELKENTCNIKNLAAGEQQSITQAALLDYNF